MAISDAVRRRDLNGGIIACVRTVFASLALAALASAPAAAQRSAASSDGLFLDTPTPLRFTTDEGTWMSVDVSPDGRTLVFDLLGDLYTLPVAGGEATRITSGPAFDAMPRFSPDGAAIAFVSDRSGASNVWVASADGSDPRQISRTNGYWIYYVSPAWTRDGTAILVSRNNGPASSGLSSRRPTPYDLYLFALDGGSGERLTGTNSGGGGFGGRGAADHFGASFSGNDTIWYSTAGENAQLHTLVLSTGRVIPWTDREGGAVRPVVSTDGRWLVYATRREGRTALRLRDRTNGEERWLTLDAQHDQMSSWPTRDLMPGMAFTPDGEALIVSQGGGLWRIAIPSGDATPIPFHAEVDQAIAASTQFQYPLDDSILEVRQIRSPRMSPDGRRVAFVALDRIWLADLPDSLEPGARTRAGPPYRLTELDQTEASPAWSPDGTTLAFVTWNDSIGGHIYRVAADGGRPERLTSTPAFYDKLAFTPDGTRLLYARTPRSARFQMDEGFSGASSLPAELVWMPVDGGTARYIARLEYLERPVPPYGNPHFGPDPARLLIYDAAGEGLISMRLDGSDRRAVAQASGRTWNGAGVEPAHDMVLSPTGDHVAILGMQHVYVASLPDAAGAPSFSLLGRGSDPYPIRRLTETGGDFVGWSPDGRYLHYSLGASLFLYDVVAADSLRASAAQPDPVRVDLSITLPKDRPRGAVALRGARIITMRGDEVIEAGDIVVRDNRIAAVGPAGTIAIPQDAEVLDVTGSTIIPGYVDTHAHMGGIAWGVHRTEPWQYYANLAWGVTSTRDPQTMTSDVIDYADRVEIGDILGPRIFSTGRAFFASDEVESVADARAALRRNAEFLRTETVKLYVVGDRHRRQLYLQAARELRLSPTSEGDANLLLDLTHLMDGYAGLEHTLPTWPLYEDVIQLVARSGTTYTPVLTINYGGPTLQEYFTSRYDMRSESRLDRFWPRSYLERRTASGQWRPDERYAFPKFAADAARIAAAGGHVAVGSHGNLQGIGVHFEIWGLAMGGMPALEVLRSATSVGARAIGHEADLGSIEPGKLADLQILDANPLADIRNTRSVRQVMKNGRLYDAATLDEVWPRRHPLSRRQWWMAPQRR